MNHNDFSVIGAMLFAVVEIAISGTAAFATHSPFWGLVIATMATVLFWLLYKIARTEPLALSTQPPWPPQLTLQEQIPPGPWLPAEASDTRRIWPPNLND
ncbi:MAG TPA: hypothetical protein VMT96_00780 [Candidatus Bathyarchaeia archaeon]|nr:hypothetical protein [Candidatus Bathyarchaeia archaeon]